MSTSMSSLKETITTADFLPINPLKIHSNYLLAPNFPSCQRKKLPKIQEYGRNQITQPNCSVVDDDVWWSFCCLHYRNSTEMENFGIN